MSKLGFSLIFFLTIGLVSCDNQPNNANTLPRPVKAIQVLSSNSLNNRYFAGKAKATQEINLSFNVGGSLIALPIKIGDKVKKGDLIAKLDQTEFEAQLMSAGVGNKSYVWVIDQKNTSVHKREVTIGELSAAGISILQGLQANEWVVTAGVHSLEEGERVTILNQSDQ